MRILSLGGVLSSSTMNCSLLAFRPSNPTCATRVLVETTPAGSFQRGVSSFQQDTLRSRRAILRRAPLAVFAHAFLSVFHAVFVLLDAHDSRRASSLAYHAILKAAEAPRGLDLCATWWRWYLNRYYVKHKVGHLKRCCSAPRVGKEAWRGSAPLLAACNICQV